MPHISGYDIVAASEAIKLPGKIENKMNNEVVEIAVNGGIGRVWESRPGHWSWAHPDGSQGSEDTCEAAIAAVEAIGQYTVVSQRGMSPYATETRLAAAIAASVKARRLGLSGEIIPSTDATPDDCNEAAQLLGWDRDPAAADMDMPVNANVVASDMARGAR